MPIMPTHSIYFKIPEKNSSRKYKWATRNIPHGAFCLLSPAKGPARHALKKRCGTKCFLLPETEKFPICRALNMSGSTRSTPCQIDCQGLRAAKSRARQWHYAAVGLKADRLLARQKCTKRWV